MGICFFLGRRDVMVQLTAEDLIQQRICNTLASKGSALLKNGCRHLDPEMADFIRGYLRALTCDVAEAVRSGSEERKAQLPLILGELYELVEETQYRIEQAAGASLVANRRQGL